MCYVNRAIGCVGRPPQFELHQLHQRHLGGPAAAQPSRCRLRVHLRCKGSEPAQLSTTMSPIPDPVVAAQTKQPAAYAVTVILPVLSAMAVSLRLYTRTCILGLTGADDWLIVVAWVRRPDLSRHGPVQS